MISNLIIGKHVPWNAMWSGEEAGGYEIRPCRSVDGRLAVWQRHAPGMGTPIFAKPHMVRQRRSIAEMRCTVCGERTPENDRWWFGLGRFQDGWFMTTEAPVHHACGLHSEKVCPHLRALGAQLRRFPEGHSILQALVGGPKVAEDFGLEIDPARPVIGNLKIAWPEDAAQIRRRYL